MRRLTLVGLSEDGTELVFTAEPAKTGPESRDGQYVLTLDEALQAAMRQDRARLGQLQLADSAALRPRDIQARVRSGQSPEEIAAAAGIPVSKVLPFARPVLAERQHVAEVAQVAVLRRRSGAAQTLGDAVGAALVRAQGARGDVEYDAHCRSDGTWIFTVDGVGTATARFAFDPAARSVVADDAAARELVAEPDPAAPAIPVSYDARIARLDPPTSDVTRAVGGTGPDAQTGQDARSPAAEPGQPAFGAATGATRAGAPGTDSLSRALDTRPAPHRDNGRGRRALRYLAFRDDQEEPGSVLPVLPDIADRSGRAGGPDLGEQGTAAELPGRAAQQRQPAPEDPAAGAAQAAGEPAGNGATQRSARALRRPPVPTWDEIMFGRKDE